MKNVSLFFYSFLVIFLLCSCSTTDVADTKTLNTPQPQKLKLSKDPYANMNIEYHDREYMESQILKVPDGVDEKRFEKLPFLVGFKAEDPVIGNNRPTQNQFSKKEWNAFKREFESALDGSRRFPLAQVIEGLADAEIRKKTQNGLANAKEINQSAFKEAAYIINVTARLGSNDEIYGRTKEITHNITAQCRPMESESLAPISWFPPFTVSIDKRETQRIDGFGNTIGGRRYHTAEQRERLHINMFRSALVEFINHIYLCFPTGGEVVYITEDGQANLKAGRANGVQPSMQFIIYAIERDNPDAIRIPLYNAEVETLGQESSSTLQIWRTSDKKSAKKIIDKINTDFKSARDEYIFYACSDGLAQRPDFIRTK